MCVLNDTLIQVKVARKIAASFVDPFCYLFFVSIMLSCIFIATLWERAGLLTLLCTIISCVFVTFPCGVLGQVWYLIVLIPYVCRIPYFHIP